MHGEFKLEPDSDPGRGRTSVWTAGLNEAKQGFVASLPAFVSLDLAAVLER